MDYVSVACKGNVATVRLSRGKVNALNPQVIGELKDCFDSLAGDAGVKAVILMGAGRFFSFGFDIPEFLSYSREEFTAFLTGFTNLYTDLFLYPKPLIGALNGHTIAGGCMLATACDYRVMVEGKAKISLNEIGFGSSVFAGSVEMLRFCVGSRNAQKVLYSGGMFSAREALELGLIDRTAAEEEFPKEVVSAASDFAGKDPRAFESIKRLVRGPVAQVMKQSERGSIFEFVDIWYSESTWKQLQDIKIRS